ncbi:MAG: MMPL family transporter [Saprospiraceae bacterium]|nr:MMPL family transporter [Saprospiraceae bacterium]
MNRNIRILIFCLFGMLAIGSAYFSLGLKFNFEFEQFFPQGDPDLDFFKEFIADFEADDNFMLVAVERSEGVFDSSFLANFHDLTISSKGLPHITESQSLTKISYPIRTPFGLTSIPAIHLDEPARYDSDKEKIMGDERFLYNLIAPDTTAMVLYLKTIGNIKLDEADELMNSLDSLVQQYPFEAYHFLGRPYFQKELVDMQKREITVSAGIAGLLVTLIMFFIFRRPAGIAIAMSSVGLGMLLFMGFLGATGRELNAMAALYPVLMIIVGTSDVIHIMSKYIDELRKGLSRKEAVSTTIREIGLATLLTSITTAVGFATLMTSRVYPIRDFGINAAAGVIIAYLTVIFFTTAALSMFDVSQLVRKGKGQAMWEKYLARLFRFTKNNGRSIAIGGLTVLLLSFWGISRITTNYSIINNLPTGKKITEDFRYFEEKFTGFRPMDLAVFAQGDYLATDFEVVQAIDTVEQFLHTFPGIRAINSISSMYKSVNQLYNGNRASAYRLPDDRETFDRYKRTAEGFPQLSANVLLSHDGKKARITSRVLDIGADSIKQQGIDIDNWITANVDPNVATFRRTGTGLLIDKNAEYVRSSLLYGLALALVIISILMVLLFRDWRMLIVSLVPNVFPLVLAGAMLGFLGIELEAGVAIVFAVAFGIAVDDTIHFLSKVKLVRNRGKSLEESLRITTMETGKAIVLTSVILFFGFLVMLFSIHPPSVTVGLLISMTLFSALLSDLLFIPPLMRWLMPEKKGRMDIPEKKPAVTVED